MKPTQLTLNNINLKELSEIENWVSEIEDQSHSAGLSIKEYMKIKALISKLNKAEAKSSTMNRHLQIAFTVD